MTTTTQSIAEVRCYVACFEAKIRVLDQTATERPLTDEETWLLAEVQASLDDALAWLDEGA